MNAAPDYSRLKLGPILCAFATRITARYPDLRHQLGHSVSETFVQRAYVGFRKAGDGNGVDAGVLEFAWRGPRPQAEWFHEVGLASSHEVPPPRRTGE